MTSWRRVAIGAWATIGLGACEVTTTDSAGIDTGATTGDTGEVGSDDADGDGFAADVDCDDADDRVHPGAASRCDVADADCDAVDEPRTDVPGEAADLTAALLASAPDELVCLGDGSYGAVDLTLAHRVRIGATHPLGATLAGVGAPSMALRGGTVTLEDLVIGGDAGALVVGADAELVLERCALRDVSSAGEGALAVVDGGILRVRDTTIDGLTQVAPGDHGALWVDGGELVLERVTFDRVDTTSRLGGLIAADDATLRLEDVTSNGPVFRSDSLLQGGIVWANDTTLTADLVRVWDARVVSVGVAGGLFYGFDSTFDLTHAAFAGTRVDAGAGSVEGGIASLGFEGSLSCTFCTWLDQVATGDSCSGAAIRASGPDVHLHHTVIQETRCGPLAPSDLVAMAGGGTLEATWSAFADNDGALPEGAVGADGNLDIAGLFTSATEGAWDLRPAAGSPLVDAGDPALTDDDGSRADIGAHGGPGGAGL